jgi:hypothetical protein
MGFKQEEEDFSQLPIQHDQCLLMDSQEEEVGGKIQT